MRQESEKTVARKCDRSPSSLPKSLPLSRPPLWSARLGWGLVGCVAIAASLYSTDVFTQEVVNVGGLPLVIRWLQAGLHPDLSREFLHLTLSHASLCRLWHEFKCVVRGSGRVTRFRSMVAVGITCSTFSPV